MPREGVTRAPALFIGHGSPMNAIEDSPASRGWAEIVQRFPKPDAIVLVSAHWVTDGVKVMANARPRTIHDFGRGFPQALFDMQYPAPGDPALAQRIVEKLAPFGAELDESWGLDHGAWSVLVHMYPNADVPVVQVSLDQRLDPAVHYEIGRVLSTLRDDNVLMMASGNIVHNLRAFFQGDGKPRAVDASFEVEIESAITTPDHDRVARYLEIPGAAEAAPDWDHFTPLLYALGAGSNEQPHLFNRDLASGISMTSVAFGVLA